MICREAQEQKFSLQLGFNM